MATVEISRSFSFLDNQDWDWTIDEVYLYSHLVSLDGSEATFSSVKISNGVNTQYLNGNVIFSTVSLEIVRGTVTSSSYSLNGEQYYSISGLSLDAGTVADFALNYNDTQETYSYALSGSDTILGSADNDVILGYAGSDNISAGSGDDIINGGSDNDYINGGDGIDTATFSGLYSDYFISNDGGRVVVTDSISFRDGENTLENVERLEFSDLTTVTIDEGAPVRSDAEKVIIDTYMAMFNRAPEFDGFQYWVGLAESEIGKSITDFTGSDLSELKSLMADAAWVAALQFNELTGYSEEMTTLEFVEKVYGNVLGRPNAAETDMEGLLYWAGLLDSNEITSRGAFVAQVQDFAYNYINQFPDDPISIEVDQYLSERQEVASFFSQERVSGGLSVDDAYSKGVEILNNLSVQREESESYESAIELLAVSPGLDLILL